jgi:hypothetical protein
MKVIIGIPCLLPGGTEFQTLQLARVLRDAGHEVSVCCYFEHDPAMVAAFGQVNLLGLERSISPWRLVSVLRRAFAGADVVHVQYMAPGFLAVLAAELSGARVRDGPPTGDAVRREGAAAVADGGAALRPVYLRVGSGSEIVERRGDRDPQRGGHRTD